MGRRNSDKLIFVAQFPEDRPTPDRGINKPAPPAMEPAKRQISTRHCLQSLGAVFAKRCFNERKGWAEKRDSTRIKIRLRLQRKHRALRTVCTNGVKSSNDSASMAFSRHYRMMKSRSAELSIPRKRRVKKDVLIKQKWRLKGRRDRSIDDSIFQKRIRGVSQTMLSAVSQILFLSSIRKRSLRGMILTMIAKRDMWVKIVSRRND